MITIYLITGFLILIYLLYPLWLMMVTSVIPEKEQATEGIHSVSLILLSYNGKEHLKEKVDFLVKELSYFQSYELIIIDDNSNDGSKEYLNSLRETDQIKIICKSSRKGIPNSMNLGVANSRYDYIIFCDQRQKLSDHILQRIVEPLKFKNTGAVSGCICHMDKENKCSFIRRHENFIKAKESQAGNLIGVYGPFYAIKKQCYSVIPDDIILDDLYLSLRILKSNLIELREDCRITDENFSYLNDYKRTRRYVSGFIQILKDRTIIRDLSARQKIMLIWHKYIRLFIPLLLFLCYISAGLMIMQGIGYLILFCILTVAGLLSFIPLKINIQFRMKNLVRINILYFIALSDIFINDILLRRAAVCSQQSAVSSQQSAVSYRTIEPMKKPGINKDIAVMKPFMPPVNEMQVYLERIWESRQLTNNGRIHEEFEKALCDYLGVKHLCLMANGTLALIIALKALDLKGAVITTPFTSVATAQAIYWNNLKPVFVDINESDFNISITEIERAVTPQTSAILPVHLFGNPCNVLLINELARKCKLKVVYDAAHCFGVELDGDSVCNFGDLSVLSFHATKVFNTFEGGAIICRDESMKKYIDSLKNTGLDSNRELAGYGINAKMNEIQSAFGLVQLKYIDKVIASRKEAYLRYRELLKDIKGLRIVSEQESVKYNYAYFPVIINPVEFGASRDEVAAYLESKRIFARKYFYPLVSDFPEFSIFRTNELPVARKIAENIICLPLYHDISFDQVEFIVDTLKQCCN